jgi:hypothetical protein
MKTIRRIAPFHRSSSYYSTVLDLYMGNKRSNFSILLDLYYKRGQAMRCATLEALYIVLKYYSSNVATVARSIVEPALFLCTNQRTNCFRDSKVKFNNALGSYDTYSSTRVLQY